jgi:hypothetical protein
MGEVKAGEKTRKEIYVGFWADKDDLAKLDKLVEYFKERLPYMRVGRSSVIRMLIDEKYRQIATNEKK